MLGSQYMVVANPSLAVDEYLHTTFEHDREFVLGEVVERTMPTTTDCEIQGFFVWLVRSLQPGTPLRAYSELRIRLHENLVRIPDVSIFEGRPPEVPATPPLVAIEIASPDDRFQPILEKLAEYRSFGIRHIWLVEPELKALYIYEEGSLKLTPRFSIPEHGIEIPASQVFASSAEQQSGQ